MRVPQEMAYAILATLPAVTGLYVAFFAVLTYAILGTSKHISVGTWAVLSIMVADAIDGVVATEKDNQEEQIDYDAEIELRIQVAISLCLLVGIIQSYIEFFSELYTANTCAIIVSIVSLLILVIIGEINDRQAAKGWFRKEGQKGKKLPIPSELLVVVLATLSSYLGDFEDKYDLSVVGDIPTGLPFPVAPPTKYFGSLISAAIAIAVVGFAISIAMGQLFARKYNYEVDANQLASILASVIVLVILLWLGPLLTQLPECVLAAIIVIALRGMFRQVSDLPMLWKVSIFDFLMWLVAFTFVVFLGVDLGLLLAVIFALITIVVRNQSPYCALMGRVPDTDIYRDISFVQDFNVRNDDIFQRILGMSISEANP
ncbi:solute carrier family 26 member 6-like [Amphiura filiformis]|uniref:solute carrier family 26 member 6-like n=1 Tax=Amphiura filiformis TaxID=82378 RepID=UPI003B21FF5A